jgi:transposase-like protein
VARSPTSPRELKLHDSSLGNWVRDAREQAAGAPSATERAEIRELRAETERVTRERDILGKQPPTSRRSHLAGHPNALAAQPGVHPR